SLPFYKTMRIIYHTTARRDRYKKTSKAARAALPVFLYLQLFTTHDTHQFLAGNSCCLDHQTRRAVSSSRRPSRADVARLPRVLSQKQDSLDNSPSLKTTG